MHFTVMKTSLDVDVLRKKLLQLACNHKALLWARKLFNWAINELELVFNYISSALVQACALFCLTSWSECRI